MKINTSLFGELTFLNYCPLEGAVESLEFVTNIHESFSGIEERDSLRAEPKQTFGFNYNSLAKYFDVQYQDIRKKWAIPFLQDSQLVGDIAIDDTVITCNTTIADLRPDTLAVIYSGSEFEIVEVKTVNLNNIVLYSKVKKAFVDAWIAPVRVGYFDGEIKRSYLAGNINSSVSFRAVDSIILDSVAPPQYKGDDLYTFEFTNTMATFEESISQQQNMIDYNIGGFATWTNHTNARVNRTWNAQLVGNQELYDFKRFLFRRMGMFKPFWLPLHERNLQLKSTGLIVDYIEVVRTDYITRKNIALLVNNAWIAVSVSEITSSGLTTRLDLSAPLSIQAADIKAISYLGLYRLNSDTISLNYIGGDVVNAQVPLIEIHG